MHLRKIISSKLFFLLMTGLGILTCKAQDGSKKKPNIIFIMADDHAYQAISAYKSKLIQTPNIDKIASNGVLMKQSYVTNSVCSPSRAVLLTGKYSHLNGMKDNGTYFNGSQETLPKIFQKNGYQTAIVGKWHLFSEPTGFDYWNILPDQGNYYSPKFIKMGRDTAYNGYVTDIITDLALDWIGENKEQPFFLMLHHKAPHRNFMPPIKYLDKFNDVKFPLPSNFYDDYKERPALQRQNITVKNDLDVRYDSKIPCDSCPVAQINEWAPGEYEREMAGLTGEERKIWDAAFQKEFEEYKGLKSKDEIARWQFQRYMEDYLRCVMSVDDNIGRVLKYLEENKLSENTVIVYTSDQGFYLGEHGLYDKRFMYKESFRTPLMISYPGVVKSGRKVTNFTMNLDIPPTLLEFSGIPIPEDMQGVSLLPLVANNEDREKKKNWRKEMYYHYYEKSFGLTPHYGIQTKRYKLIHFYGPVDAWELYDMKKDPSEMKNRYNDPKYEETVKLLKEKLRGLQLKYKDNTVN